MSGLIIPKEAICDRAMVSAMVARAIHLALENEPDYKELIEAAKNGKNSMGIIHKLYQMITEENGFSYSTSRWFKKSCKLSYDSGLFGMTTKGRREFYFDVQRNL